MTQDTQHATDNTQELHDGKIQYWQNGLMAGLISQKEAVEMVNNTTYRIINSQAIEWIGDR